MARAMSVNQVLNKKRNLANFEGKWLAAFGRPELSGSWIIWGDSGHGKTTFTMMLCKYLSQFDRVAYNSLEEGDSASIANAMVRVNMQEARRRFILLDKEPMDELRHRLSKRKSPKIVVIDSVQYSFLTKREFFALKTEFDKHLFIFISHQKGKLPEGRTAEGIRYNSNVKVRVEGFRAFVESRYNSEPVSYFTIWPEEADKYWGADI